MLKHIQKENSIYNPATQDQMLSDFDLNPSRLYCAYIGTCIFKQELDQTVHTTLRHAFLLNLMKQKSFHVQNYIIICNIPQYSIIWIFPTLLNQSIDGHLSCFQTFQQALFEAFLTMTGPPCPAGDRSELDFVKCGHSVMVIQENIFIF